MLSSTSSSRASEKSGRASSRCAGMSPTTRGVMRSTQPSSRESDASDSSAVLRAASASVAECKARAAAPARGWSGSGRCCRLRSLVTPKANSTASDGGTSRGAASSDWNIRQERAARAAGSPNGVPARAASVHQTKAAPEERAWARAKGERTTDSGGGAKSTGAANSSAPGEYCPIRNGR